MTCKRSQLSNVMARISSLDSSPSAILFGFSHSISTLFPLSFPISYDVQVVRTFASSYFVLEETFFHFTYNLIICGGDEDLMSKFIPYPDLEQMVKLLNA